MAVSALGSSQVHAGNKTSVRSMDTKALAGKELILATKDVSGPSLCTLQQITETCGHLECSWKGNISLDESPGKVALHPTVSVTLRLLAGYFIKCFQQA